MFEFYMNAEIIFCTLKIIFWPPTMTFEFEALENNGRPFSEKDFRI